jgi:hypothetical protein
MDMVLRPHKWDQFCPDLLAKCHTFSPVMSKNWHGLTPMAHQEPAAHLNITYQPHMEDIQWSGGSGYGFKAAKCQTFSSVMSRNWHGLTPMAHQEPAAHLNITCQTQMEDIQRFEVNGYGFKAA